VAESGGVVDHIVSGCCWEVFDFVELSLGRLGLVGGTAGETVRGRRGAGTIGSLLTGSDLGA
jgi:hypothetical protein